MERLKIPSIYRDGFSKAVDLSPERATSYVEHTIVGDPMADAAIEALAPLNVQQINRFMNACLDREAKPLQDTPHALREFIEPLRHPPAWFDRELILPGRYAFHEHLDLFIVGFIVVILRNFDSLMSRVFFLTGQHTTQQGLRLIRNNIRFLTEALMLPASLDHGNNGWKFSIRVRLVHARIRRQLRKSGQWNEETFGVPISAANMALASANFSASMIRDVERLGANLNCDARVGLMQIWRYVSWLMGTPENLLYEGDESETAALSRIGHICEPPPDAKSVVITNATVRAIPEVAEMTDPIGKQTMVNHGYRVCRAMLGNELADEFKFPKHRWIGVTLPAMRSKYRVRKTLRRFAPNLVRMWAEDQFLLLLNAALIENFRHGLPEELALTKHDLVYAKPKRAVKR